MTKDVDVAESDRRKEMAEAVRAYSDKHGKDAALSLMQRVAGVHALSKIPVDKIGAVIAACEAIHKPGPRGTIADVDVMDKITTKPGDTLDSIQPAAMARFNRRKPS